MNRPGRIAPPSRYPALILSVSIAVAGLYLYPATSHGHDTLPEGFRETDIYTGLTRPTAVRFAPDGRVFVAEKSGIIKTFDDVTDTTPTVFADLSTNVYAAWDRGLLGLAVHPDFPALPYVYVLYTYDAAPGETPPVWGDDCPDPPGFTDDGCVVSGRLSRLTAAGDVMTGPELVLVHDWCQQYPSHSIGDLHFGPDGALYASAGDGASFNWVDHGQRGNPCGDPPEEGGALRSQDIRTAGDPVTLDGTLIRIDPANGMAPADNPLYGGAVADDDRIIAYGLRNPFRFTVHPLNGGVYIGDVGWGTWEEINRVEDPTDALVENFGWPCWEGGGPQPGYDNADLPVCEELYAGATVTAPLHAYVHDGSSAVTGLAFYTAGDYPPEYDGALFFADYSARWIKVMFADASGDPDPGNIATFRDHVRPVDLTIGPGGDLFYVEHSANVVRRVEFFSSNQPPVAEITADVTSGPSPLVVHFDSSRSSDPDDDPITYAWDLDGDGVHDDSTLAAPQHTYNAPGTYLVGLKVEDPEGASDSGTILISVDNSPPVATILTPLETTRWRVGEVIAFSGKAEDPDTGPLPPEAMSWSLILHHCFVTDRDDCHEHGVSEWSGTAGGEFTTVDHEPISFLELRLTATEPNGDADPLSHTDSVVLLPETTTLTLETAPPGLELSIYAGSSPAPFTREAIVGSVTTVAAPAEQSLDGVVYSFDSWSDGGDASHEITVPETDETLTATYTTSAVCQEDIGFGGPGDAVLAICGGDLSSGTTATLSLTGATPNGLAVLFFGVVPYPVSVAGGVLVPFPYRATPPLLLDESGRFVLPGLFAGGGGPVSLYFQFAYTAPEQPLGWGFSNAVRIDLLP